ncbi:hypothetical protein AK812_SmicGene37546 [Symbiodinium microadriaticum]|uniref:Uncharacterized protein n=1 Tax=Symbiodinium microadriaticum TaxID=2951 RepID=A0A1Q9CG03_SYMMI|nr:hypothetical protein AK812_SmicGene37546 [Symbiodinium microadriaticum]
MPRCRLQACDKVLQRRAEKVRLHRLWGDELPWPAGILRRSLQVLPNKRWCIKGGFTLELLLIHIDKVESFEQELPEETRAELEKGDEGSLRGFPFFHPWAFAGHLAKLTNRQANLLAALAEHIVGQALPSIRSLIRPPVPPLQMSFAQKLLEQPTTESTVHKV